MAVTGQSLWARRSCFSWATSFLSRVTSFFGGEETHNSTQYNCGANCTSDYNVKTHRQHKHMSIRFQHLFVFMLCFLWCNYKVLSFLSCTWCLKLMVILTFENHKITMVLWFTNKLVHLLFKDLWPNTVIMMCTELVILHLNVSVLPGRQTM